MATVRLGVNLKDEIYENAGAQSAGMVRPDPTKQVTSDMAADMVWQHWITANNIDNALLHDMERVGVLVRTNDLPFGTTNGVNHGSRLKQPRLWWASGSNPVGVGWKKDFYSFSVSGITESAVWSAAIAYHRQLEVQSQERVKFLAGVKAVLNRHTTLKSAMAEWPGLWELVPDEAKRRHQEVVVRGERKPPPEAPPAPDVDDLNLGLMKAKLSGQ